MQTQDDLLLRIRDAVAATTRLPPQTKAQKRLGELTKTATEAFLNFVHERTEVAGGFAELAVENLEHGVEHEIRLRAMEEVMES